MEEEEDVEEEEQADAGGDADVHGSGTEAEQPDAPDDAAAWQAGRRMRRQLDSPLDMNLRYAAAGGDACFSRLDTCYHNRMCAMLVISLDAGHCSWLTAGSLTDLAD